MLISKGKLIKFAYWIYLPKNFYKENREKGILKFVHPSDEVELQNTRYSLCI